MFQPLSIGLLSLVVLGCAGPGPVAGRSYLYLGDIGDNTEHRDFVTIYRLEEPALEAEGPLPAARIELEYPRVPGDDFPNGAQDAETLLVDPLDGSILIVTKSPSGTSHVYEVPASAWGSAGRTTLLPRVELHFGEEALEADSKRATGGAVSADGRALLIRTRSHLFLWRRLLGQPLWHAFARAPCALAAAPESLEPQGEAVTFTEGGDLITLGESRPRQVKKKKIWSSQPLLLFERQQLDLGHHLPPE